MKIMIEVVSNGYWVIIDDQKYTYTALEVFRMLEEIGKRLFGKKIRVVEPGVTL